MTANNTNNTYQYKIIQFIITQKQKNIQQSNIIQRITKMIGTNTIVHVLSQNITTRYRKIISNNPNQHFLVQNNIHKDNNTMIHHKFI